MLKRMGEEEEGEEGGREGGGGGYVHFEVIKAAPISCAVLFVAC